MLLRNPAAVLMAMIRSDVPTAVVMGTLNKLTSAGIIKKPPPAPTNPVTTPTMKAVKIVFAVSNLVLVAAALVARSGVGFEDDFSMARAAASMSKANDDKIT